MAKRAVLRYNPDETKCEVEIRDEGLPDASEGELFGDEIPEDGVDVIETEDGKTVIVIHQGAGPLAFEVTGSGEITVNEIPSETYEEPEEYFEEEEAEEAGADSEA